MTDNKTECKLNPKSSGKVFARMIKHKIHQNSKVQTTDCKLKLKIKLESGCKNMQEWSDQNSLTCKHVQTRHSCFPCDLLLSCTDQCTYCHRSVLASPAVNKNCPSAFPTLLCELENFVSPRVNPKEETKGLVHQTKEHLGKLGTRWN